MKFLQTVLPENRKNIKGAIEQASLGWETGLHPLITMSKSQMIEHGCPEDLSDTMKDSENKPVGRFATVRKDNGNILGVVGSTYNPLQNRVAFDFFQSFLDSGECELDTIGCLFGGTKVIINAKINRDDIVVGAGDKIEKFLLLSNSHDGSSSLRVGFIPKRITCMNQLPMINRSKESMLIRFKHASNIEINLKNIKETIDTIDGAFKATAAQYNKLLNYSVNKDDVLKYVKLILEVDEEKISTRTQNKIDEIVDYVFSSPGNDGKSAFSILNGFTYYTTHKYGRNEENRFDALNFGAGAKLNERAASELLRLVS